jgi:hypothetical protein
MAISAGQDITVPGGVKVFFTETGGSERDLGNIVGDSVSIARDTEELEHFTNRSGARRKDKVITVEESAQIDFELDEINVDNLRYFFKGGAITSVGAGTTAVVDQEEILVGEIYNGVGQPGLTAVTVRQFLDYVFLDDNGVFVDNSVEADTITGGTPFLGMGAVDDDFLYMGKDTIFGQVDFVNAVNGSYGTIVFTYWDGSSWAVLTTGGVDDFTGDGVMTYTVPADWAKTTVNSVNAYWIRANVTATVTTAVTFESIGRNESAALVEHTDYDVDPGAATGVTTTQNGAVRAITAGALETGEAVKVSYTYATFTSQTFGIAETSTLEGSARFEALPGTGRGRKWSMTIPKCQLVNNGSMDLDDTDFETIPLSLVILDNFDCDPANPFGTVTVFPHA